MEVKPKDKKGKKPKTKKDVKPKRETVADRFGKAIETRKKREANMKYWNVRVWNPSENIYILRSNQERLRKMKHKVLWLELNLRPCDSGAAL